MCIVIVCQPGYDESAKLRALHSLAPMHLTHNWYASACLRAYAPYPSLKRALGACVPTHLYPHNKRLRRLCLFLLQTPLCLSAPWSKTTMDTGNNLFWANLLQKIKIVSLNWNLVPRLIRICAIQWCCWLFQFLTKNTLLGQILIQNTKIVSLSWNLVPRLIRICIIQWCCSLFLFKTGNTVWSKNSKLSV